MPAIRPEDISNRIRLTYEFRAAMRAFIPEDSTVDSVLAAVIDEVSPHKHGIGAISSQHDLFAWADKLLSLSAISVLVCGVVAFIHLKAIKVSVFR
jgi:hypothetical protein